MARCGSQALHSFGLYSMHLFHRQRQLMPQYCSKWHMKTPKLELDFSTQRAYVARLLVAFFDVGVSTSQRHARLVGRTSVLCSAIDTFTQHHNDAWRPICAFGDHGTPVCRMLCFHFVKGKEGKRISKPNRHRDDSSSLSGARRQTLFSQWVRTAFSSLWSPARARVRTMRLPQNDVLSLVVGFSPSEAYRMDPSISRCTDD